MRLLDLPAAAGSLAARLRPHARRLAVPVLATVAMAAATLALYQSLSDFEGAHLDRDMESEAARLKSDMQLELNARVRALDRLARRWQSVRQPTEEEWAP